MANKPTQPMFPLGLATEEQSELAGILNTGVIEHGPDAVLTVPEGTAVDGVPSSIRYNATDDSFEGFYENGGWLPMGGGGIRWEALPHASTAPLAEGRGYLVDNTTGASTVVLPTPTRIGDSVTICDAYGKFSVYPLTIDPDSNLLYGSTEPMTISTGNVSATFTWSGEARGWIITSGVGLGQGRVYSRTIYTDTLTAETAQITLVSKPSIVDVYVDGKRILDSKYSLDGNDVNFSPSLASGSELQIIEYVPIQLGTGVYAGDNGASLVGTTSGSTVQEELNSIDIDLIKLKLNWAIENGYADSGLNFTTGGTLGVNDRNKVVYDPASHAWYSWVGVLPKVIPTASSPASTGGVSDSAWKPIVDSSLRNDLSTSIGSGMVGHPSSSPAPYDVSATVKGALNRLIGVTVFAALYGVKADGTTDDTLALRSLSRAISAMTDPVIRVVFPQGTSLVGAQDQAPNATSGYAFRPSYYATEGNVGWFYVKSRAGTTIIDASGWTIKLKPGMKHGAFDPVTGNAYTSTLPFRGTNYQAWAGHLVAFKECEHIIRIGLTVDGSAGDAIWGGRYGDSGWQCPSFGIWDTGVKRLEAYNDKSINALLDNLYIGVESSWTPAINDLQRKADYYNCIYTDGRRQNVTIAGAQNVHFHGGQAIRAGRKCLGVTGNLYSAPETNVDIESESGPVYDLVFDDFKMIDGGLNTFVAASFNNPFARATLNRCLLRSDTTIAQIYVTGSTIKFNDSIIEGSGFDLRTSAHAAMVELNRCIIRNHINGVPATFQRYVGEIGVMTDCIFDIVMNAGFSSLVPMFQLSAGKITASPAYPTQGIFNYNRMVLSGNQDLPVVAANGRTYLGSIQFFFDMDLRFSATGLSGTRLVDMDTSGSNVNIRGITTDSNKVVDRATGTVIAMAGGGYYFPRSMSFACNALVPMSDNAVMLGSSSRTFQELFMGTNGGIRLKDSTGKVWRLAVSVAGALVVTAV